MSEALRPSLQAALVAVLLVALATAPVAAGAGIAPGVEAAGPAVGFGIAPGVGGQSVDPGAVTASAGRQPGPGPVGATMIDPAADPTDGPTDDGTNDTDGSLDDTTNDTDGTTNDTNDTDGTTNDTDGSLTDTDGTTKDTDDTTNDTDDTTNGTEDTTNGTDGTLTDTDESANDTDQAVNDSTADPGNTTDATGDTTNTTDETLNDSDGATNATDGTANATEATGDAVEDGTNATDGTTDAASNETGDAVRGVENATGDATETTEDAVGDATDTADGAGSTIANATDPVDDATGSVANATDPVEDATVGNATDSVTNATEELPGSDGTAGDLPGGSLVGAEGLVEAGGSTASNATAGVVGSLDGTVRGPGDGSDEDGTGESEATVGGSGAVDGDVDRDPGRTAQVESDPGDAGGSAGPVGVLGVTLPDPGAEPATTGAATLGILGGVAVVARRVVLDGSGASAGAVGALRATVTARGRGLVGSARRFVLVRWYQRYDDADPLEHEKRERIYRAVEDDPGIHLSAVAEDTGVPLGTVRYHLDVLEHENLVTRADLRGKHCVFPVDADPSELAAVDDDGPAAAVLSELAHGGPDSVSGLAETLDRDPSTITYHVERLADDGLVEREREGRAVVNRLAPGVAAALRSDGEDRRRTAAGDRAATPGDD